MCICKGLGKRGRCGGDGWQRGQSEKTLSDASFLIAFLLSARVKTPCPLAPSLHDDTVVQKAGRLKFGKVEKVLTKFNFLLL